MNQAPDLQKFSVLADFGLIVAPEGYVSNEQLKRFSSKYPQYVCPPGNSSFIADVNYPNPSRILLGGDKFRVKVHEQTVEGWTTVDERMEYLMSQHGNAFLGVHGLTLVFDQLRERLPKGLSFASYDVSDHLYKKEGYSWVAMVHRFKDTDLHCPDFTFSHGSDDGEEGPHHAFLGFTAV